MTTARAKRIYLCNLFPLWEKDDDRLIVDWGRERAAVGAPVEMRVTVRSEAPLDPADPTLAVRFDVFESDFLLSGGTDDHMASIGSAVSDDDGYEQRPLRRIATGQPIADADRTRFIFLSLPSEPAGKSENTDNVVTLLQAWWTVRGQDDAVGAPEYYFDVAVSLDDDTMEERSDHELEIAAAGAFGSGLTLPGADRDAIASLVTPAQPVLENAGWATDHALPGETVELVARVRGASAGQIASFRVVADSPEQDNDEGTLVARLGGDEPIVRGDTVLEHFDVPVRNGEARVGWTLPPLIPARGVYALRALVGLVDRVEPAVGTPAVGGRPALYARLELCAALQLQLTDTRGRPLANVKYTILRADGQEVAHGRSESDGLITVADLPGADYIVEVEGLAVVSASEPDYAPPPPDPKRVVISVIELARPNGAAR